MPILTLTATGSNVAPSHFYLSVPFFIFFHVRFDKTLKCINASVCINFLTGNYRENCNSFSGAVMIQEKTTGKKDGGR